MAEGSETKYKDFLAAQRSRLVARTDLQRFKTGVASDSFHSYDPREKERYTTRINKIMAGEPDFTPINPHGNDLWKLVSDGKWLCKFLNKCQPNTVDEAIFNKKLSGPMAKLAEREGVNPWANTETLNQFLEGARAVGLEFGAVGSSDFAKADEEHKEHLILGVLWQLLRRQLANEIKDILARQKEEMERAAAEAGSASAAADAAQTEAAMAKALKDPETFLCEWVNATLKECGVEGVTASSIGELSTTNSAILVHLVNGMDATETSSGAMEAEDPADRANAVIAWASEHGIPSLTQAEDLRETNPRLILPFVMGLFTWYHTHKANKDGDKAGDLNSVWVVRQHWHLPAGVDGDGNATKGSCSSSTICAFKREDEALRYVLAENMTLVGTDPELPHLLTLCEEYAATAGYAVESVFESLGPIPGEGVLEKPAEDPEDDDAEKLRARVDLFVKSCPLAHLKSYQDTLSAILQSHSTVKVYALDSCQIF